jgi:hypothetical protein
MQMTVRKFTSHQDVKDEEYRYWQSVPAEQRIQAIYDHSVEVYRDRGTPPDGQQLKRTVVRFERTQR